MAATQEQKTGVIDTFYDEDTGAIKENGDGILREFYHKGAKAQFVIGETVTYLIVITPNGKVIVKDIKKPN